MFQFPGCPSRELWIHSWMTGYEPGRVSPFGRPWINACLRLPVAFRSLPRPSSAISAMASTLCSCSLNLVQMPCRTAFKQRYFTVYLVPSCSVQLSRYALAIPENDIVKNVQSDPSVSLPLTLPVSFRRRRRSGSRLRPLSLPHRFSCL